MIWVGTSGYNYPEWKGSFYPQTLPAAKMLPYYAERFPTVEINYTFYRAPNEKILEGWNKATPDRFKLTLKAPHRITHDARLRDCGDRVRQFLETASTLGPKLGALLFQLPPNLKKDLALFDAFLDAFPPRVCAAFEFRHPSWLDDEVYSRLRARNLALCVADSEKLSTPVESPPTTPTSGFATRATRPTTSAAGPTRYESRRRRAATCSCTSSTKSRGRGRSSRGS